MSAEHYWRLPPAEWIPPNTAELIVGAPGTGLTDSPRGVDRQAARWGDQILEADDLRYILIRGRVHRRIPFPIGSQPH